MKYDLQRFVDAQAEAYPRALTEISKGRKTSHWMWYIFPQLAGLGSSDMAQRYAIASIDEARAYLAHPLLGIRFRECVIALQDLPTADAEAVFGAVDAMKLHSSLTLFSKADPDETLFRAALLRWFPGAEGGQTLALLNMT
jgi:uncharacterized protein (DUF1810 family)